MKKGTFLHSLIRGAVGKEYVVKHYKKGIIITRYPNMKNIIASSKQKVRRSLFKKAVKYAQQVYADPIQKDEKKRILRRPKRLFQALMKEWFKKRREREAKAAQRIDRWRTKVGETSNVRREMGVLSFDISVSIPPVSWYKDKSIPLQKVSASLLC